MRFELLAYASLPLQAQLMWIWYSDRAKAFVVGDDKTAYLLPIADPASTKPVLRADLGNACNLPISADLFDEFVTDAWHGFEFIKDPKQPAGDLLRMIVFGPDYAQCVRHPASGAILSFKSGSMRLLGEDFKELDKTKTRGKASLAFAGHPSEPMVVYGDNYGVFHAHRFDKAGFGKASKVADKQRKASRIEISTDGTIIMIGGMGYLSAISYKDGKFTSIAEVSESVRDFIWNDDLKTMLVNRGMHGIASYRFDGSAFSKLAEFKPDGAVAQMAVSKDWKCMALSDQQSAVIKVLCAF